MVTVAQLDAKLDVKDGGANKRLKKFGLTLSDIKAGFEIAAKVAKTFANVLKSITTDVIEQGAEIDKWAKKIGVSATELQALEFAGKAVGAEVDNTREAIKTLRENLGEMERVGSGPAVDALMTLGIALEDIIDLPAAEQFALIAERMRTLKNDSQRTSVALEVMGEDGGALLPLFAKTGDEVRDLTEEFHRLGIGLDDTQVALAGEVAKSLGIVEAQFESFKLQIGAELLPVIKETLGEISKWVKANRALIKEKIAEFVDKFVRFLKASVPVVKQIIRGLGDFIESMGGAENAIKAVIAALVAMKLAAAGATGAFGLALLAGAAAGTAIGRAMADAGDEVARVEVRIRALRDEIRKTNEQIREVQESVRKVEQANATTRAKIAAGKKKLTTGFDTSLVTPEGLPTDVGERINKEIKRQVLNEAQRVGRRVERRLLKSGLDADRARIRALAAADAAIEKGNKKAEAARAQASKALLAGGRARQVRAAVTGALAGGGKRRGKAGAGGAKGAQTKRAREFQDILDADKLRKRVAEGEVTPTILITVTNFNIAQEIQAPVTVAGLSSTTAQEVVAIIQRQFDEMQENAIRRGVQDVESRVAR